MAGGIEWVPGPRAHIWLLRRPRAPRCFPAAGIFLVAVPAEAGPDSCQERLGEGGRDTEREEKEGKRGWGWKTPRCKLF